MKDEKIGALLEQPCNFVGLDRKACDRSRVLGTRFCDEHLKWQLSHSPLASTEDLVNHPPHYTSHPSGIECIQVTEHMGFNIGNAVKYLWRADEKGSPIEDLRKAIWYINREIEKREKAK